MDQPLACPTCAKDLVVDGDEGFRCEEEHRYTVVGLALTNNLAAVRALWMAIRALEEDAAGLQFMATKYGDGFGQSAEARRAEAEAALEAAALLRDLARRAQQRLDALPSAPSAVTEAGSERGRGG